MPDYKKMYLEMFIASQKAVELLQAAQQKCEELYVASAEADLQALPLKPSCSTPVDSK